MESANFRKGFFVTCSSLLFFGNSDQGLLSCNSVLLKTGEVENIINQNTAKIDFTLHYVQGNTDAYLIGGYFDAKKHRKEFSEEDGMWWCCGKTGKNAKGCKSASVYNQDCLIFDTKN